MALSRARMTHFSLHSSIDVSDSSYAWCDPAIGQVSKAISLAGDIRFEPAKIPIPQSDQQQYSLIQLVFPRKSIPRGQYRRSTPKNMANCGQVPYFA
jgi:hypothetical protein